MPDEGYWESLFDLDLTHCRLRINRNLCDVAELGCGYGTFTVPVARAISGTVHTFDIDPAMVERTRERAQGLRIDCQLRDVMADGFGVTGVDAVLLFNILHGDNPVSLLNHAADAVRPGGLVLATHWLQGETPGGPDQASRPLPEQMWAQQTGRLRVEGPVINLPPWHFGLRLPKWPAAATAGHSPCPAQWP
jgi:SAM-dependent methyltransferase